LPSYLWIITSPPNLKVLQKIPAIQDALVIPLPPARLCCPLAPGEAQLGLTSVSKLKLCKYLAFAAKI
jgi:hypothetical protein